MNTETQTKSMDRQIGTEPYDVAILGGGMAGLTLALQLKRQRPETSILVVDKQRHPVPEAAHKVGESTVEVAAHYLRDVLGLADILEEQHLRKFGLRMFFSNSDNSDIARRVEYGQIAPAPLPSYQLDRGRLENALGALLPGLGVAFVDGAKIQRVELLPEEIYHRVQIAQGEREHTAQARWVVDATGRSALLKRQLGLAKAHDHHANSAWFRVPHPIDVNEWSDDIAWKQRVCSGERRLSTNHLMGHGYWVWIIPLASGSTSIGIVADAAIHPFEGFNRFDRAMEWLATHEPQCAKAIRQHGETPQDFHVMKDYSYTCEQVYSGDRWCLAGEAAVAIDPLYSSGGDLIAVGNGLICDLITRDLGGENIGEVADGHSQLFLVLANVWLVAYQHQYPLMGNAKVMVAKLIWDTVIYWAFPGLLYFHDQYRQLADKPQTMMNLYRCWELHARVQAFFREWHAVDHPASADTFADPYSLLDMLVDLHNGMAAGLPDPELEQQFAKNTRLLEQMAGQLVATVRESLAESADPLAKDQIMRWDADPALQHVVAVYHEDQASNPIDSRWVILGQQHLDQQEIAQ